jgi:hypothetical protein
VLKRNPTNGCQPRLHPSALKTDAVGREDLEDTAVALSVVLFVCFHRTPRGHAVATEKKMWKCGTTGASGLLLRPSELMPGNKGCVESVHAV